MLLGFLFVALGFVAFLRTNDLRQQLSRAEARLVALEHALRGTAPREASAAIAPVPAASVTPPPTPAAPAPRTPERERVPFMARVERALASNWFVWVGGLLIAAAIIALLRYEIQEGHFGPIAQLASAYVLGAALISAGEWTRQGAANATSPQSQIRRLPAILAATGLFAWFTATFAGYANLHVLGVRAAFALMALSSVAAIIAALRFGRWLAALGLLGGYLAPALVQFPNPSPALLFGYLLALTAVTLAAIRLRKWRGFIWLAGAGALAWGWTWAQDLFADAQTHAAASAYIVALAVVGFALAWSQARAPLQLSNWRVLRAGWTESVLAAHALAFAAGADLLSLAIHTGYEPAVLFAILALCALACIAASRRESFALIALASAALAVATIWAWPMAGPDDDAAPLAASYFFAACGTFGFVFTAGGWLMMLSNRAKAPGAALAALAPMAILLVSHQRAVLLHDPAFWAAGAIVLATLDVFALRIVASNYGGIDRAPGPSAAFALGAAAGVILSVLFAFTSQPLWGFAALALLTPIMAWLDLRFRLPALRLADSIVALIVVWGLGPSLKIFFAGLAHTPLLNPILPVYGAAAAAFWGAGLLYRRGGVSAETRIVQTLEAAALVVAALGVSLEIRHLATGGNLRADGFSLGELGADVIAWLGLALGMAARFGPKPRFVLLWAERVFFALATFAAIFGAALVLNPWWGWDAQAAPGRPILNLLLVAYGIPAALFAAYAILRRRQGARRLAAFAGAAASVMAFLNITLEVRRLYHPAEMANADILQWEAWSYTVAWIAFAAALLALGLIRRQPSLRYASLIVLIVAIMKAFGFDIHALGGVLLAAQLLGLGVSAIAVAMIYQRFVAPRAGRDADPNIIPPR